MQEKNEINSSQLSRLLELIQNYNSFENGISFRDILDKAIENKPEKNDEYLINSLKLSKIFERDNKFNKSIHILNGLMDTFKGDKIAEIMIMANILGIYYHLGDYISYNQYKAAADEIIRKLDSILDKLETGSEISSVTELLGRLYNTYYNIEFNIGNSEVITQMANIFPNNRLNPSAQTKLYMLTHMIELSSIHTTESGIKSEYSIHDFIKFTEDRTDINSIENEKLKLLKIYMQEAESEIKKENDEDMRNWKSISLNYSKSLIGLSGIRILSNDTIPDISVFNRIYENIDFSSLGAEEMIELTYLQGIIYYKNGMGLAKISNDTKRKIGETLGFKLEDEDTANKEEDKNYFSEAIELGMDKGKMLLTIDPLLFLADNMEISHNEVSGNTDDEYFNIDEYKENLREDKIAECCKIIINYYVAGISSNFDNIKKLNELFTSKRRNELENAFTGTLYGKKVFRYWQKSPAEGYKNNIEGLLKFCKNKILEKEGNKDALIEETLESDKFKTNYMEEGATLISKLYGFTRIAVIGEDNNIIYQRRLQNQIPTVKDMINKSPVWTDLNFDIDNLGTNLFSSTAISKEFDIEGKKVRIFIDRGENSKVKFEEEAKEILDSIFSQIISSYYEKGNKKDIDNYNLNELKIENYIKGGESSDIIEALRFPTNRNIPYILNELIKTSLSDKEYEESSLSSSIIESFIDFLSSNNKKAFSNFDKSKLVKACGIFLINDKNHENLLKIDEILEGKIDEEIMSLATDINLNLYQGNNGIGVPFQIDPGFLTPNISIIQIVKIYDILRFIFRNGNSDNTIKALEVMEYWNKSGFFNTELFEHFKKFIYTFNKVPETNKKKKRHKISPLRARYYKAFIEKLNGIRKSIYTSTQAHIQIDSIPEENYSDKAHFTIQIARINAELIRQISGRFIYLIRHGEEEGDPNKPGGIEAGLTEKGRKETIELAEKTHLIFDIICGSYKRVIESARIFSQLMNKCEEDCDKCSGITVMEGLNNFDKRDPNVVSPASIAPFISEKSDTTTFIGKIVRSLFSSGGGEDIGIISHNMVMKFMAGIMHNYLRRNIDFVRVNSEPNIIKVFEIRGGILSNSNIFINLFKIENDDPEEIRLFDIDNIYNLIENLNDVFKEVGMKSFFKVSKNRKSERLPLSKLNYRFINNITSLYEKDKTKFNLFLSRIEKINHKLYIFTLARISYIEIFIENKNFIEKAKNQIITFLSSRKDVKILNNLQIIEYFIEHYIRSYRDLENKYDIEIILERIRSILEK